jgi:hypothetical protein
LVELDQAGQWIGTLEHGARTRVGRILGVSRHAVARDVARLIAETPVGCADWRRWLETYK